MSLCSHFRTAQIHFELVQNAMDIPQAETADVSVASYVPIFRQLSPHLGYLIDAATRSSKYSQTLMNRNCLRVGRTARIRGCGHRLTGQCETEGIKIQGLEMRVVNIERAVTTASGEMYPW